MENVLIKSHINLVIKKFSWQIQEMQQAMAEKTSSVEAESFKNKRLQEENALIKRKNERLKKIEMASDMDEILREEIR